MSFVQLQPRLLDRRNAAVYCGVSINHFLEHVAPHVREVFVNRKRLFDRSSIDRWIDAGTGEEHAGKSISDDELLARLK